MFVVNESGDCHETTISQLDREFLLVVQRDLPDVCIQRINYTNITLSNHSWIQVSYSSVNKLITDGK